MLDRSTLRQRFIEDGLVVVDDAIPRDVVDDIVSQLQRELADPVVRPESGSTRASSGRVDLEDPGTWLEDARRVIGVPPGEGRAWAAVLDRRSGTDRPVLGRKRGSRANEVDASRGRVNLDIGTARSRFPGGIRRRRNCGWRRSGRKGRASRAATSGRERVVAPADDVDGVHEQGRAEVARKGGMRSRRW